MTFNVKMNFTYTIITRLQNEFLSRLTCLNLVDIGVLMSQPVYISGVCVFFFFFKCFSLKKLFH